MSITVDAAAGIVWIDGEAKPTSQSVAKMIRYLGTAENKLFTHEQIEEHLNVSPNTRRAYLRDARKILDHAGYRVRAVKGEGVVFERVPEGVTA